MSRRALPAAVIVLATVFATGLGSIAAGSADAATTTATKAPVACSASAFKNAGKLAVATGDPAFPPWVEDDKPQSGKGFEAALIYAIAKQLGVPKGSVSWTRTGFDEAVAPGDKSYDLNLQQYSISGDRKKVVDLSNGYYDVQQAIVARAGSKVAKAKSLSDLKSAKLGAAIGTTSLDYIDKYIKPKSEALVFDDNAAAKAAFDAHQVDGIVFDLPTAYEITAVEIPNSKIVGILPQQGKKPEQLGILLAKGSALTSCVNKAIANLQANGTVAALQKKWLAQGGNIPTLKK